MELEKTNLIEDILSTIQQEIDFCKQSVKTEDTNKEDSINRGHLEEAIGIYNMVQEVVSVWSGKLKQIKDKRNLTLTEAIIHARHVQYYSDLCESCKAEHGQLADWLEELRTYRRKALEDEILNPKPVDKEEEV